MSLKFSFRGLVLAAGERKRIDEVASFFMLVSNTGALDVKISIDNSSLSDCPVGYDYTERKEDTFFEHIDFVNPNAGSITIEYILSIGLIKSVATISGLAEILGELRGDVLPLNWDNATIGVAQSQVLATNANRKSFSIQAESTNTGIVYIGFDNTVAVDKWWAELLPSQSCGGDDYRGPLYAIASAAGQDIGYAEV